MNHLIDSDDSLSLLNSILPLLELIIIVVPDKTIPPLVCNLIESSKIFVVFNNIILENLSSLIHISKLILFL